MKWDSLFIAALGSHTGEPAPVRAAVEAGLLDAERYQELGYTSVCVDEVNAPPDNAVAAASTALERGQIAGRDLALLLHGSLWFQGLDIWPAGSYIAAQAGVTSVPAIDLQQRCNVGVEAIEVAGAMLAQAPAKTPVALITTADRFAPPAVDRWNMHELSIYGDGATAMALSTESGFAQILSTATVADNTLEERARGDEPFSEHSPAADRPIDLTARAQACAGDLDATQTAVKYARVMMAAKYAALKQAGITDDQLKRFVPPANNGGLRTGSEVLGIPEERGTWGFGRTTGHVGGGDCVLGLEHLLLTGGVEPGDHILLFGGGAGYTCTAVVVEILDIPEWS